MEFQHAPHAEVTPDTPINSVGNQKGLKLGSQWMKTPEGKARLKEIMRKRWAKIHRNGGKFLGKSTQGNRGNRKPRRHQLVTLAEHAVKASVEAHTNGTEKRAYTKTRKNVAHIYYLNPKGELQQGRVMFSGLGELVDVLLTRFAAGNTITEARLEFDV